MVTPKIKAEQLVRTFFENGIHNQSYNTGWSWYECKCMAQLTVDEIIKAIPCREDYGGDGWVLIENTEYWQEVKPEIEKL